MIAECFFATKTLTREKVTAQWARLPVGRLIARLVALVRRDIIPLAWTLRRRQDDHLQTLMMLGFLAEFLPGIEPGLSRVVLLF